MFNALLTQLTDYYYLPLFKLIEKAHEVHRLSFQDDHVQKCALLSIKTGGCPEDCGYCPQSAHYRTGLKKESLVSIAEFEIKLAEAKRNGAERFCLGAAWREVKDGEQFERVLEMVRLIKKAEMEACVTLGMLEAKHAQKLKEAGLDAYNHNLDTSRDYYPEIISTRTYEDRLKTLSNVREAGLQICCGGIIGMGESIEDRLKLVAELAAQNPQPESVPINLLIPVDGTPLGKSEPVDPLDLIRLVAVTRIMIPKSRVRLSAGRMNLSRESQLLAFYCGANSIFLGEKLLTRENPTIDQDDRMLASLGV